MVFNANPLLRYDGYYILSDITEIPNLRQKSTSVLSRKLGEWLLGLEQPDDPFLPERNQVFFALYSVAASIYQWVVVYSILFFLYHVFKPYHAEKIGQLIAMASLWGLIVMPLYQLGKFFYVPGRLEKVKKTRMFISLTAILGVLAAVLFIPLPHWVMASMEAPAARGRSRVRRCTRGRLAGPLRRPGRRQRRQGPGAGRAWRTTNYR